jgi:hypothetical protein
MITVTSIIIYPDQMNAIASHNRISSESRSYLRELTVSDPGYTIMPGLVTRWVLPFAGSNEVSRQE